MPRGARPYREQGAVGRPRAPEPLLDDVYPRPIHYDFLAHAFLDLRNYAEAARMCERAAEL